MPLAALEAFNQPPERYTFGFGGASLYGLLGATLFSGVDVGGRTRFCGQLLQFAVAQDVDADPLAWVLRVRPGSLSCGRHWPLRRRSED